MYESRNNLAGNNLYTPQDIVYVDSIGKYQWGQAPEVSPGNRDVDTALFENSTMSAGPNSEYRRRRKVTRMRSDDHEARYEKHHQRQRKSF